MTTPGHDNFFFAPAPPQAPAAPAVPTRVGYVGPGQPALTPSAPVRASRSVGWLLGAGVALVVVLALVIGFVVLAHKDKHTEGNTLLRPVQQAGKVQLDSDLRLAATAEESYRAETGNYTANLSATGYRSNGSVRVAVVSASPTTYCLTATNASSPAAEYYASGGGPSATPCH